MNKYGWMGLALGLVMAASSANAYPRKAACVGGPRAAAYAYDRWEDAQRCRNVIASQSRACAEAVRVGVCRTDDDAVDSVNPNNCVCNGGGPAVGYWD